MYKILYTSNGKLMDYCVNRMDLETAKRMLNLWLSKYWDETTNSGKAYPNGKESYPVTRAQIVRA